LTILNFLVLIDQLARFCKILLFSVRKEGIMEKKEKPAPFKTVLDNGIRVIVKENRSIPVVSLQASFLGGVRFEKESQNGINQFMAVSPHGVASCCALSDPSTVKA
jgi:hypothetical protein